MEINIYIKANAEQVKIKIKLKLKFIKEKKKLEENQSGHNSGLYLSYKYQIQQRIILDRLKATQNISEKT
jgi:hypothetical protein